MKRQYSKKILISPGEKKKYLHNSLTGKRKTNKHEKNVILQDFYFHICTQYGRQIYGFPYIYLHLLNKAQKFAMTLA